MPKMKTKRSAAKRFTLTGTGKIKHNYMGHRHKLTHKSRKRVRHLGKTALVHETNLDQVRRSLCLG
jgi:large subunit ribosomal protein L35